MAVIIIFYLKYGVEVSYNFSSVGIVETVQQQRLRVQAPIQDRQEAELDLSREQDHGTPFLPDSLIQTTSHGVLVLHDNQAPALV